MRRHAIVDSPLGELVLVSDDGALRAVWVHQPPPGRATGERVDAASDPVLAEASRQLDRYFAGGDSGFDLPLAPEGTEFQRRVWAEVGRIPRGQTRSYGQVARAIGSPRAAQAVGSASARNPLSIVIPCHRLTGADGTLTGYPESHDRKRWLLALERGTRPLT